MPRFLCPYLRTEVELTDERAKHVAEHHPDLAADLEKRIASTLADPDQIRRSTRHATARLFSKNYHDARGDKHVVIVVVSDVGATTRHWVVTAYWARRLAEGEVEWIRS